MINLIVGLGNPGDKYKFTRHNLGFILLDSLGINFRTERKFKAEVAEISFANNKVICLKPQTYMNLSGEAVHLIASFYQIEAADCLIIHDELDLPFGSVRLKMSGGEGRHNGLKSISQHLGTRDYPRLRMGIGKPQIGNQIPIEDWVLQRFFSEEKEVLEKVLTTGQDAIKQIFQDGFSKTQSLLNSQS